MIRNLFWIYRRISPTRTITGVGLVLLALVALFSVRTGWTAPSSASSPRALGAETAIAPVLHYQGRLLDPATGAAKPDGAYEISFRLYDVDTGGTPLWTETKDVDVKRGLFNTLLGDTTALPANVFNGQNLWLGIKVGLDSEAAPRQRIAPVAYALYADNADRLDGQQASAFATAGHNHDAAYVNDNAGEVDNADIADGAVATAKLNTAGASTGQVLTYDGTTAIWTSVPRIGLLRTTVLNANCTSVASFDTTYKKLTDIGSFNKIDPDSTIEVTFNGRIAVVTSLSGTGARFELRVDNTATSNGRARASFKAAEVGNAGVPASITGIFSGLNAGTHTVSMWVQTSSGTGQGGMVDPGCWSSDHVVIKEFK